MKRSFGILMPITALPSPHGIGDLGPASREFISVVADLKATWWQILPLGPTGYGDSPYQTFSTFAGNELLISLEDLQAEGLMHDEDFANYPQADPTRVDYGAVIPARKALLKLAASRFKPTEAFTQFCQKHAAWLEDYAMYTAIKASEEGRPWCDWPADIRSREEKAMAAAKENLSAEITNVMVQQFFFYQQWERLHDLAKKEGVGIIGDIPIFVAHDSADAWSRQDLYFLDQDGQPTVIAGVPPDYFSPTGQRWGNPLYRWEAHKAEHFNWWIQRVEHCLSLVDLVRIDHFRGFAAYWEVPASEETAMNGKWIPAPGRELFDAIHAKLGAEGTAIIAEDLGMIDEPVHELRDHCGYPGMRVVQFSYGQEKDWPLHWPDNIVAYSGTHDNNTLRGWLEDEPHNWHAIRNAHGIDESISGADLRPHLLEVLFSGESPLVVVPWQDILGLGSEARINVPGKPGGNWQWRIRDYAISKDEKNRISCLAKTYRRI